VRRRVFFRRPASDDLDEAFRWYEAQRPGLGEAFLEELEAMLALVVEQPEAWPLVAAPHRRALMTRFPYAVYYRVTSEWVQVLAVFHVRRDPRRLRRRLSDF
jgi:plasmid stabilization system protein ParE